MLAGLGIAAAHEHLNEHRVKLGLTWIPIVFFALLCLSTILAAQKVFIIPSVTMLAVLGISVAHEYPEGRRVALALGWIPIAFFIFSYVSALHAQKKFLFKMAPMYVNRQMHPGDGFSEAVTVGDYVRSHTTDQDRIAVLASEPEIYFYSGRHSVTGYIYMYPMMEKQKYAARMQGEMIEQIEQSPPKLVVYTDNLFNWGCGKDWPESDPDPGMNIFLWMHGYLEEHYEPMAEVPIHNQSGAPCSYFIFQRK
jgi:hypothetical protein